MDLLLKPKEKRNGLQMMYWIAKISFIFLGVAAAPIVPYSVELFLSFRRLWIMISLLLIFIIRKLTKKASKHQPNNILELAAEFTESWSDVPSSPASDTWYDFIWKPSNTKNAEEYQSPLPPLAMAWYDVPSSPISETWYDFSSSPTTTATCNMPPEVKKEVVDPLEELKTMVETWINDVPSSPSTTTFSSRTSPCDTEPLPPEFTKEMVDPWVDENKSMDDTWDAIMEASKGLVAKSMRRQRRREEGGVAKARKGPKKEVVPMVVKEEAGWRRREVLVVSPDELFQRVETFIKKHHDHLRIQREQSAQRYLVESLRWSSS